MQKAVYETDSIVQSAVDLFVRPVWPNDGDDDVPDMRETNCSLLFLPSFASWTVGLSALSSLIS